jgi:hypothetical protein
MAGDVNIQESSWQQATVEEPTVELQRWPIVKAIDYC